MGGADAMMASSYTSRGLRGSSAVSLARGGIHTALAFTLVLLTIQGIWADESLSGPVFLREPPNRIDFSNTTGTVIECAATGNPRPEVVWVRLDGSPVTDVPGLRQVQTSGSLVFPPFRAEDYRQEVHAQVYRCMAKNSAGTILSRDVHVRAVVQQNYQTEVNNEHVIRGNAALLKCSIPSFVADFVSVTSWLSQSADFGGGVTEEFPLMQSSTQGKKAHQEPPTQDKRPQLTPF